MKFITFKVLQPAIGRETSLLLTEKGWEVWTSSTISTRKLIGLGYEPVEIRDSYARFMLPEKALRVRSGQGHQPRLKFKRFEEGGEVALSRDDAGPGAGYWNIICGDRKWAGKLVRRGWPVVDPKEALDGEVRFLIPRKMIGFRSAASLARPRAGRDGNFLLCGRRSMSSAATQEAREREGKALTATKVEIASDQAFCRKQGGNHVQAL